MSKVNNHRMSAHIEGDFVVFLIGMRINKPWKIHKWLPTALAMSRMLKELAKLDASETGFLGLNSTSVGVTVQYWRSFDHLEAYAKSAEHEHLPAWTAFNRRMKSARGDVGIWHETFLIKDGNYESVYAGMPPFGLGRVTELVPATGKRKDARSRMMGSQ